MTLLDISVLAESLRSLSIAPLLIMLSSSVLTVIWHIAHFWVSYGRSAMHGLPMGYLVGLSYNRLTD